MMKMKKVRVDLFMAALMVGWLSFSPVAAACSVCFGNQEDPMVQGAANGVLFMVGVTYAMLLGMGAFVATWFVRSRRIRTVHSVDAVQDDTTRDIE